ncbi:MAG TPA: hypothetical protein VGJ81_00690 [Thermoanaerobaculia bacterium]|jgi:hypothetical protein
MNGQQLSEGLRRELAQLNAKPQEQWSATDLRAMERLTFAISREVILSGMTEAERNRVASLRIEAVDQDAGPPAWLEHGTIFVSRSALLDFTMLGFVLGHDVFVDNGDEFPVPTSLLTRPYVTTNLIPLLSPLDVSVFYRVAQTLLKCPSSYAKCAEPQGAATIVGVIGFVIAHEMSHEILGHGESVSRSQAEELAADERAWHILMRIAPDVAADDEDSLNYRVRVGIAAGPRVFLRWLLDRTTSDALKEQYDARLSAFTDGLPDSLGATVFVLTDPAIPNAQVRRVVIRWSETPGALFINGVPVRPEEIEGKQVTLAVDTQIFARSQSGFAYAKVAKEGELPPLVFVSPVAGVTTTELNQLRRQRKWFEIILRTANNDLRPRRSSDAGRLHDALRRVAMARAINPADAADVDRRLAALWRRDSEPLESWRAP